MLKHDVFEKSSSPEIELLFAQSVAFVTFLGKHLKTSFPGKHNLTDMAMDTLIQEADYFSKDFNNCIYLNLKLIRSQ